VSIIFTKKEAYHPPWIDAAPLWQVSRLHGSFGPGISQLFLILHHWLLCIYV